MQLKPWINQYDAHVPASIQYPQSSLVDLLNSSVYKFSEKTCIVFENLTLTYRRVDELSSKLAKWLASIGIKRSDKVGIIIPNLPQFILVYFAILKCGGIVVAMNPYYRQREIQEFIELTEVKAIFCLEEIVSVVKKSIKDSASVTIITSSQDEIRQICGLKNNLNYGERFSNKKTFTLLEILKQENFIDRLPEPSYDDPAILQITGGTTGTPKAAIGLHKNLVANTIQFCKWCNLQSGEETFLSAIPLYHVYGMVLAMCLGIYVGAKIVLMTDPRRIDVILQLIEKFRPTFFPGVPGMFYGITINEKVQNRECDLSSIRACISGSAPLPADVKRRFELLTGGKLMEGYGLSEAPTATHCNPLNGKNKVNSIGLPLSDVDCRIMNIDNEDQEVPPDEVGELVIRGPQVMQGYLNNPQETLSSLRNGWLYTGDVAHMDQEGYFYIIDRKKSLIKVSGFQVWPSEIEKIINEHYAVKESCVGGIPEKVHGEKVIAWVVLKPNLIVTQKEIKNWCRKHLVSYKIPNKVIFIPELPKTTIGKILRRELIRSYLEK